MLAKRLVLGIDEAGRGPVVGPMIIAGVVIEEDSIGFLSELGVNDSKLLSRDRREELYYRLEEIAYHVLIVRIDPDVIDIINLNILEYDTMGFITARVLEKWGRLISSVFVDSVGPETTLSEYLSSILKRYGSQAKLVVSKQADRYYIPVAAASIVAKVVRDQAIKDLEKVYGRIGSGYPHDPETREWIRALYRKGGEPPPVLRLSWSTLKTLAPKWYRPKTSTTRAARRGRRTAPNRTLFDYIKE